MRRHTGRYGLLLGGVLLVAAGCELNNADSGSTAGQSGVSVALATVAAESGSVSQNGAVYHTGVSAGDTFNSNEGMRGFMSFDLTAIPSNAVLDSATLDLGGLSTPAGDGDPFDGTVPLGNFQVYALNYDALDGGDYNGATYAMLYNSPSDGAALSAVAVKDALQAAVANGFSRFQIRLQFATQSNGDGVAQLTRFDYANAAVTAVYEP